MDERELAASLGRGTGDGDAAGAGGGGDSPTDRVGEVIYGDHGYGAGEEGRGRHEHAVVATVVATSIRLSGCC